jgi:hypothetical protein
MHERLQVVDQGQASVRLSLVSFVTDVFSCPHPDKAVHPNRSRVTLNEVFLYVVSVEEDNVLLILIERHRFHKKHDSKFIILT